ncbi:hypothetical protein [Nocardia farcinica]|uniref:hypothetical protein n=1 Tax=Nocardia farcinica TaxID=37329 RepID=UPI001E45716A|nr:hypothetical protein [Nocardia farcinica]UEX26363.1 hypothetical protein LMJ57_30915 [Nocardia farcinica]
MYIQKKRSHLARAGVVAAVVVTTMLLAPGSASAAVDALGGAEVYAKGINPFEGVVPDFTIFGAEFNNAWRKLLAGIWGLCFVVVGFGCLRAVVEYQSAKKGGYAQSVAEKADAAKTSAIALGALTCLPLIVGGIVSLV